MPPVISVVKASTYFFLSVIFKSYCVTFTVHKSSSLSIHQLACQKTCVPYEEEMYNADR